MNVRAVLAALLLATAVSGCKKEAAPPKEPAAAPDQDTRPDTPPVAQADAMQSFLIETGEKDLRAAKESLGRDENPLHLCAAVTNALPKLAKAEDERTKAYAEEAARSCGFEIPIAWAGRQIKRMQNTREKRPAEVFFVECVEVEMALEGLLPDKRSDPRAVELQRQHDALCSK